MAKRNKKRGRKPQYTRKQRKAARTADNQPAAVPVSPLEERIRDEIALACIRADIPGNLQAALQQAQRVAQMVQARKGMQDGN